MAQNQEHWRAVDDFINYEVSDKGRVRNAANGRILKNCINDHMYYAVNLRQGTKKKCAKVHQLVAKAFVPNPNDLILIDHIDRDRLNNTKENLRWCSYSQNNMNKAKETKNVCTSMYKGVCWCPIRQKWRATMKGKHIGLFKDEKDAAQAYNEKAKEMFGEFAFVNTL